MSSERVRLCKRPGCGKPVTIPGMAYHARECAPFGNYGVEGFHVRTALEVEIALKEGFENGLSLSEVATQLGITFKRAHRAAEKLGLTFRDGRLRK